MLKKFYLKQGHEIITRVDQEASQNYKDDLKTVRSKLCSAALRIMQSLHLTVQTAEKHYLWEYCCLSELNRLLPDKAFAAKNSRKLKFCKKIKTMSTDEYGRQHKICGAKLILLKHSFWKKNASWLRREIILRCRKSYGFTNDQACWTSFQGKQERTQSSLNIFESESYLIQ